MAFLHNSLAQLRHSLRVPGLEVSVKQLQEWFTSPMGQHLLEEEQKMLDQVLSCLFGYHLLQMSVHQSAKLYGNSRVCHCVNAGVGAPSADSEVGLYTNLNELPFEDESIDVTLLHHVLDFSDNPHQLLREASRVTIARGYIIVVGFNPFSTMGMVKPFAQLFSTNPIWKRHSLRRSRVADWLKFLDCQVVDKQANHFNPPVQNSRLLAPVSSLSSNFSNLMEPFGSFYCMVARKDRTALTPIRPNWVAQPVLVPRAKQPISARSAAKLTIISGSKPNPGSK